MNRLVKGLLIGVGVAVVSSLIILLLSRDKQRRFLQERFEQVRGALPEREQVQQYAQQATTHVSQFAGNVKDTALQTMGKVKQAGNDLAEKAKQLTPVSNQVPPS